MDKRKILIVYYTHPGETFNGTKYEELKIGYTKLAVNEIVKVTKAEIFEVKPKKTYPSKYTDCIKVAKKELKDKARPEIVGDKDIKPYDTIILAFPIWWSDLPMAFYTFLENKDFKGKRILPFCTHGGGGPGNTKNQIKKVCKGATVTEELDIIGYQVKDSSKIIDDWLKAYLK